MNAASVQDRVTQNFAGLSPQLRKAARYVVAHPDEVATRSLRRIAEASALPPPTFSRLARAIGYASYEEMRETCRGDIARRKTMFADKALQLLDHSAAAGQRHLLLRQAGAAITGIQSLAETVDLQQLDAAAQKLSAARRVCVVSNLSAHAFGEYITYLASIALPGWYVAGGESRLPPSRIIDLGPDDAVLTLSFEPYSATSVSVARQAAGQGAYVVAITDGAQSPMTTIANLHFLVSTESPQFFPSHVAALVLIEALVAMVVRNTGELARRRIASIEKQAHEQGHYWRG